MAAMDFIRGSLLFRALEALEDLKKNPNFKLLHVFPPPFQNANLTF